MKRNASGSISDSVVKKRKVDECRSELEVAIPKEILQYIFSFCTVDADQRKIRLVCLTWFNIINYSKFTIGAILPSEMSDLVKLFSRCNKPIGLHLRKMHKYQYNLEQVSILSRLSHLTSFSGQISIKHQDFFDYMTNLQSLEAAFVYATTLVNLTKLTTLKVFQIIRSDPTKEKIALRKLKDAELCLFNVNEIAGGSDVLKHLTIMQVDMSRIKNKWSALESLRSDIIVDDLPTSVTKLSLTNDRHWNYTHLKNLKSLSIESPQCDTIPLESFPNLEEFVSQSIQRGNQSKSFFSYLPQLQHLTKLDVKLTMDDDLSSVILTNLRDLSVVDENGSVITLLGQLTNLTKLAFRGEFRGNGDNYHDWILNLTSLVDLSLHHYFSSNESYNLTPLVNLTRLLFTHLRACKTLYVSSLTNLVELQLNTQKIVESKQIDGLTALSKLTSLRFDHQTSYDTWQQIATLTNLLKLVDARSYNLEEDRISLLTGITKLTCLRVPKLRVQIVSLMQLTRLQRIDIQNSLEIEKLHPCLPFLYPYQ